MSPHLSLKSSLWLRLGGVALLAWLLLFGALLLLPPASVQAKPSLPTDQAGPVSLNSPNLVPGTPALSITVEATSSIVVPGQTITYNIELHHLGGTTPILARLGNCFSSATLPHVDGMLVEASGNVSPTSVQFTYTSLCSALLPGAADQVLSWQGAIGPDSRLRIRYPAEVKPCYDPNLVTLQNQVVVQRPNGSRLTDAAAIQVNCLPAVAPAQVSVSGFFGTVSGMVGAARWANQLVPGKAGLYQIELTNADPNPTVLGLVGLFPSRSFNIGMPPSLQRTATLGWKVEEGESLRTSHAETQTIMALVPLAGGETRLFTLPVRLKRDVLPDSEFEIKLGYCITYDGRTCPDADSSSLIPPPSLEWQPSLSFTVRYRDLGDAADSSNHFIGTAMAAYPGVPAAFPTVFDPATGPVQGPVHRIPRPFHLGRRVSPEAEADVGPDLDPTNNLIPPLNLANRDRRDDGVAVNLLNFNQCQTSLVPVRVLIRPAAVAHFQQTGGKGYLNLWLDGNHDGDWADDFACPQGQTAVEHIVIDHQLDVVALGAGVHILPVPTDLVPWSGEAAWLRATLSEKPANKTLNAGGINYGDGRGYSTPFLLGETEDYLLRPPGAVGAGPDMVVGLDSGWRTIINPVLTRLKPHYTSFDRLSTIAYRNQGSQTAEDVVLTYQLPPALQNIEPSMVMRPDFGTDAVSFSSNRINFSLGKIEPDAGGAIILSWQGCLTCIRSLSALDGVGAPLTGSVIVQSSNDISPANNQADTSFVIPDIIEVGFASPGESYKYKRTAGTTCRNTIELRGRTSPNAVLSIFTDGFESGDVSADANGNFETLVTLANGPHQIILIPKVAGKVKRVDKASPLLLPTVNNHLSWNPSSLAFKDSQGRVIQPPAPNRFENQAGWYGHFLAGETYQVSLEYCGSDPRPVIQASFFGQTITLTDPDGHGIYRGSFSVPAVSGQRQLAATTPLTMSISADNVETVFSGIVQAASEGVVYDSQSGQGVDAMVTLLQAIDADSGAGFALWTGTDYGQANPQLSSTEGQYAFWPGGDTYRLAVSRDGYQPYRSWDVQTTGQPVNLDLPLTPEVGTTADYVVEIGPDGFEPALLTVLPGSVIEWVNLDIAEHTSISTDPGLAGPGTLVSGGWDSGALGSGQRYSRQFNDQGTFSYADQANPANTGQVVVVSLPVYLPLVVK